MNGELIFCTYFKLIFHFQYIILTSRCSSLLRSLNVSRWEKIIEIIILTIEIVYDIFSAIESDNFK